MQKINFILKFQILFILTTIISVSSISSEECNGNNARFAVVELFTSEGCSDCPEADKNLNELSYFDTSKNIYPLAFHVTYWDYIGWKDSFGSQEFTNRQGQYSNLLRARNYTPQAVVNGKIDIVGSRRKSLHQAIKSELSTNSGAIIELKTIRKGNTLDVKFKVSCNSQNQSINFAIVEKGISSIVTRGENRGSTLKHENVVRSFKTVSLSKNTGSLKIEYSGIEKNPKNFELISFLQDTKTFAITGAARVKSD